MHVARRRLALIGFDLAGEDAAHDLVEGREGAEARLDDGVEPLRGVRVFSGVGDGQGTSRNRAEEGRGRPKTVEEEEDPAGSPGGGYLPRAVVLESPSLSAMPNRYLRT